MSVVVDYIIDRVGIDMRENHDWVYNSLEHRYGTTQYNAAVQEYMNTMEPYCLDVVPPEANDEYVSYTTPFFGLTYDFAMEAECLSNPHDQIYDNDADASNDDAYAYETEYEYNNTSYQTQEYIALDMNDDDEMSDRFIRNREYYEMEDIFMVGDILRE